MRPGPCFLPLRQLEGMILCTAVLLAAGIASGSAATTREGSTKGSLGGTVVGLDGKPVASARVIMQVSDGSHPHATKTDSAGHFRFGSLHYGNYDIRAQARGQWSDWEHNILVRSGQETRLTLRLLRKEPPAKPPRPTPAKAAPSKPTP